VECWVRAGVGCGGGEGGPSSNGSMPVCLSACLSPCLPSPSPLVPSCSPGLYAAPIGVLPCRPLSRPFGSPELLAMPCVGGEVMVIE
jgi:hypothetical protein